MELDPLHPPVAAFYWYMLQHVLYCRSHVRSHWILLCKAYYIQVACILMQLELQLYQTAKLVIA